MISKRSRARMAAALAFVALATQLPAPAVLGGPISDIIAHHRVRRQMRIPPMDKPFTGKPVKDLNTPSLAERFRKRFALKRDGSSTSVGILPWNRDSGVVKTSR